MPPRIPQYEQRTRTPQPVGLERITVPDIRNPIAGALSNVSDGVSDFFEERKKAQDRDAYRRAESNIAAQSSWSAEKMRELEKAPLEEREKKVDEFLAEARNAWGPIRTAAGNRKEVLHFIDIAREDYLRRLDENANRIRSEAHGALTSEKFSQALADRGRTVEADPSSYQEQLDQISFSATQSLTNARAQAAMRAEAKQQLSVAALRGAIARNPAAVAADLKAENPSAPYIAALDPATRAQFLPHVEKKITEDRVDLLTEQVSQTYRDKGPGAGLATLMALEQSGETDEVKTRVRSGVRMREELLRVERRQEHKDEIIAVARAIASDRAGAQTEKIVHRLHAAGALSTDEYAQQLAAIDRSVLSQAKNNASAAEIAAALAAGLPLDPRDSDHRKYLSQAFSARTTENAPPGSGPWRATAQAMAQATRMLPDQAIAWTRQAMRSPNPEHAVAAAQFFGAVQIATPEAINHPEFDTDTKAFAGMVNSMIENGALPADAVKVARANVLELTEASRAARQKAWGSSGKDSLIHSQAAALNNLIDRDFDPGWFSAQPGATDPAAVRVAGAKQLEPDFDAQTERYFQRTGDINLARDLAWKDLTRIYGESRVNGAPMMFAFPPERYGVKSEDVQADIAALLKAHPQPGVVAGDVVIVPDAVTLRSVSDALTGAGVAPSYLVVNAKTGEPILDDRGIRQRYTLPTGDELTARVKAAQEKAEAEAKAMIEAAKVRRATINANTERALEASWRK